MYPELFRIGSFPINTYGVFLALAFLGAIMITVRLGARWFAAGTHLRSQAWMLPAGLIGSKILMFWVEPEYREHPGNFSHSIFSARAGLLQGTDRSSRRRLLPDEAVQTALVEDG